MLGAFVAYFLSVAGLGYWWALLVAPIVVGSSGSRSSARDQALVLLDHLTDCC